MKQKISIPIKKSDVPEKAGGSAKYIADIEFEGMLYAKTLRSDRPRARINSIKIPELPEGYYIVDKNDIPGKNRVKMIIDDQPFFAEDVVNYIGEPILLVVGPDKEKVFEIVYKIKVYYEDIEPIFTIEEAEKEKKNPIYGDDNCFAEYEFKKGEPEKAFATLSYIVEDEYSTDYQEHIYLEPQGVVGIYENGKVTVYGAMQCPYYVKNALLQAFGWDENRIRVVQTTTGGAFGGKEEYPSLIAGHAAFAAVKTGKPVQLVFDRNEDIEVTTKRHPSSIKFKTALDENNRIIAMDVDIKIDAGANAGLSDVVLQRSMFSATGVYNIPNIRVRGKALATNKVPSGAFRGFGAPQVFFAIEMHMYHIADKVGMEPIDFKTKHILMRGDTTSTGGLLRSEVKLPEIIDTIDKMSQYREKYEKFKKKRDGLKGIGFSLFFHGCGFTGSGEKDLIKAKVKLKKKKNDKVEILVSNVDMGQGAQTALRKIVSYSLDKPIEHIIYENPDTDRVPDSGPTVASRTVMIVGGLLEKAARKLKERWNEAPELEIVERYKQPEYIRWDQKKFKGDAYPEYSWGANVVEVEIDPVTYEIKVLGIWGVYDVGVAIDEKMLRGQIEGGIIQGLGFATIEVMNIKDGKIQQDTITDYIIPTSKDFPKIEIKLIDNPYEYGPFGAKCAGELPFVGAAPALASAVQYALNVPIRKIPVTPELLLSYVNLINKPQNSKELRECLTTEHVPPLRDPEVSGTEIAELKETS